MPACGPVLPDSTKAPASSLMGESGEVVELLLVKCWRYRRCCLSCSSHRANVSMLCAYEKQF